MSPFFAGAVSARLLGEVASPEYKNKVESDPNLPRIQAAFAMAQKNLKALRDAGVQIAMGTDSGALPTRIPGWAEHHELELMVHAGLSPMEALVAATRKSAAVLGSVDRGTLQAAKRADFIILAANPLDDIRNTRQIVSIWHNGFEIKPRSAASIGCPARSNGAGS